MPPRAAPRSIPLPIGFLLLGMALTLLAACTGTTLMEDGAGPLGRAVMAGMTVLSVLLIEALWWMRPWVSRAVDAWAAACTLGMVVVMSESMRYGGYGVAVAFAFVGLPCLIIRLYVRHRAERLGLLP
jgi:hypothetical protein